MTEHSRRLLEKARHAIRAAEILFREDESDSAAGRAYYAMFYTASALLAENSLHLAKHSGVHALFGEHFARPGRINPKFHRFILDAFDRRIQADYGFQAVISREEVATMIEQARVSGTGGSPIGSVNFGSQRSSMCTAIIGFSRSRWLQHPSTGSLSGSACA